MSAYARLYLQTCEQQLQKSTAELPQGSIQRRSTPHITFCFCSHGAGDSDQGSILLAYPLHRRQLVPTRYCYYKALALPHVASDLPSPHNVYIMLQEAYGVRADGRGSGAYCLV